MFFFFTYLTDIKTSEEKQEGDIFKRRGWKMSQKLQRKARKGQQTTTRD